MRLTHSFSSLINYCHGGTHGCVQAGVNLEKELENLDPQAAEEDCISVRTVAPKLDNNQIVTGYLFYIRILFAIRISISNRN